jgi:nucleoside-diphosphate-sugar epimerase
MENAHRSNRVAITGASGYLGSNLVNLFRKEGFVVYRLTGSAQFDRPDPFTVDYSLSDFHSADFFLNNKIEVLIHCAYDFSLFEWKEIERVNVQGSVGLMQAAKEQGVERIVFISTMSAFEACASMYGKAKLEIEQQTAQIGVMVIRPGLIYSEQPGAMMGKLREAVRTMSVLPNITGGSQTLYLVHLDDLMQLVFSLATNMASADQPIIAASSQGKTLAQILKLIAQRQHKTIILLPVPWRLIWVVIKICEGCGLKIGFRSDSIISLVNQDPAPCFDQTLKTGVTFREFGEKIGSDQTS